MQALSLLAHHFVAPGDCVIIEAPTYHGFFVYPSAAGRKDCWNSDDAARDELGTT